MCLVLGGVPLPAVCALTATLACVGCSVAGRPRAGGPDAQEGDAAAKEPRGGAGVPAQEEGVHQVPGEPGGGAGEPEQGADRRAEGAQGAVLQAEDRVNP